MLSLNILSAKSSSFSAFLKDYLYALVNKLIHVDTVEFRWIKKIHTEYNVHSLIVPFHEFCYEDKVADSDNVSTLFNHASF